jgi:hypothetical protein
MIRHDRTVINSYGGIWPQIADAVRADMLSPGSFAPLVLIHKPVANATLRSRRIALGLTQAQLAARAGFASGSSVSKLELGQTRGGIARLEKALADAEQS